MGLTPFDISLAPGEGRVVVDGQDVSSRVTRVTIDAPAGEIPKVFLELNGQGTLEGEGIVHIVKDQDMREIVAEFISNVDPSALEAAALEKLGGGLSAPMSTGEAFLEALKGYVRGDDNGT